MGDIAGAEAHHDVAGRGQPLDHAREILRTLERDHLAVSVCAQPLHQPVAVGAGDRRLARGIDMRDDHGVGVVEAGRELLEQRGEPRVAMRLHHGDDLAGRGLARRAQHRLDLDGMVAVVVDDRDAVPFAGAGETPAHAAEILQRLADHRVGDAELMRDRDRRGGIERIVAPRHRQRQLLDLVHGLPGTVAEHDREARTPGVVIEIDEPHVGLRVLAIGDDAAVGDLADEALHRRVVDTHHREAIERQVLDEGTERRLDRVEGAEMVEMLGIDIGDDRDVGGKLQEGAVRLVSLDHHPVALAHTGIGAVGVDDAAIDHGRVETAGVDQRRDERGGRGLAVGAADGDALLEPHQLGEHLGAAHHRQAAGTRGGELGVVALDRGRHHHHFGAAERGHRMADRDLGALVAQALDVGAVGGVGALHRVAQIDQHLGDAAHADAADADEVDRADVARKFHRGFLLPVGVRPVRRPRLSRPDRRAARPRRRRPASGPRRPWRRAVGGRRQER